MAHILRRDLVNIELPFMAALIRISFVDCFLLTSVSAVIGGLVRVGVSRGLRRAYTVSRILSVG